MDMKCLILVLVVPCITANIADHYTVINIHTGSTENKGNNTDKIAATTHGDHHSDLDSISTLTSKLDAYETRFDNMLDKIENVTLKFDIYETKLDQILESTESKARPPDCDEVQNLGYTRTGVYTIFPKPGFKSFQVRCDMDTTTGGWTVIQRRVSDSDFYKTWDKYKSGFGDVNENFWLGNQAIHMISSQGKYKLRVDLTSMENEKAYAEYESFVVGDAQSNYKLSFGRYSGNAGDSLRRHNDKMFSTKDYGNKEYAKGPVWQLWKGYYAPLKGTEMKIRPM